MLRTSYNACTDIQGLFSPQARGRDPRPNLTHDEERAVPMHAISRSLWHDAGDGQGLNPNPGSWGTKAEAGVWRASWKTD
jgi:hypothetical protein